MRRQSGAKTKPSGAKTKPIRTDDPAAGASSGAAGLDQPQMAFAPASHAAARDLLLMEPAAAAYGDSTSSDSDEGDDVMVCDVQDLLAFVAERDWLNVEKELQDLVNAVHKKEQYPVKLHPSLFIIVYKEWIIDNVKKQETREALKIFTDKVASLYNVNTEYVNEKDLKSQVSHLHQIANLRDTTEATPVQVIQDRLSDYMYLYFADLYGTDNKGRQYSHLWSFAKMLEKPPGQKDPNFSCLSCGAVFKNCTISKMREHLDVDTKGKTCPKLTENLQHRFKEGERNRLPTKHHGAGESSRPSKKAKVRRMAEDKAPAKDAIAELVADVHASAKSLHIAIAGKPLEPKLEEQLREARDLLGEVLSQKSVISHDTRDSGHGRIQKRNTSQEGKPRRRTLAGPARM